MLFLTLFLLLALIFHLCLTMTCLILFHLLFALLICLHILFFTFYLCHFLNLFFILVYLLTQFKSTFSYKVKSTPMTLRLKIALSETLSRDTIEKPRLIQRLLIWLNYLCIFIPSLILYLFSNAIFTYLIKQSLTTFGYFLLLNIINS